jgi:glycine/D-amino acid oxidase-like deaminating enzyme
MGPKIVIIGGGIGGLTAAVACARRGLDAEVYEQASELKEVGAGVGLSLTPAGSVPLPDDGIETWGQGARFGLAPASGERIIWYATWNAPAGTADDIGMQARLLRLFGAWHDPIRAVIEATPEDVVVRMTSTTGGRPGRGPGDGLR